MISTLHGNLDVCVTPEDTTPRPHPSGHHRATLCRIRGTVLGQVVNMHLVFDLTTGEMMLFSPSGFNGAFRVGDMVVAQITMELNKAMQERTAQGGAHAQAH